MPQNLPITITPATFTEGYCPESHQQLANDIASGQQAYIQGGYSLFNFGNAEPAVADRDRPWFRLKANGAPDRLYVYFNGNWVAEHMWQKTTSPLIFWPFDATLLESFDGGSPGTVGDATGPMWEIDHAWDDRIPMGAGAIVALSALAGATSVAVPLLEHWHYVLRSDQVNSTPGVGPTHSAASIGGGGGNSDYAILGQDAAIYPANAGQSSKAGSPTSNISTLPPVRGVHFIRRSLRVFYTPF